MVKRKIIWSSSAYNQRKEILLYWLNRNGNANYSEKLLNKITKTTQQLSEFALIGKETDFKNVLVFVIDNYSVFYQITDEDLIILCFWDNRRSPDLLNQFL